jgi:hypothetical protein
MTLRNFFVGRTIVFILVLMVLGAVYLYASSDPVERIPEAGIATEKEVTAFAWVHEADESLRADGQPQTNISVEVKYTDGTAARHFIHTVPMSCSVLEEQGSDSVATSTLQCYAAGLGYRYKISKGNVSYLVYQKAFEEALPDQKPIDYEYHVVGEILF